MKRMFTALAGLMMLLLILPVSAFARQLLVPAGNLVGLELRDDTVTVAAFDDVLGTAAQQAGLQIGDQLVKIQGQPIQQVQDVTRILQQGPDKVTLTIARGSKRRDVQMEPQLTNQGPKLGIYLRQGVSGIGTVTWYDPASGCFGTLGHGVSRGKGILAPMEEGSIYPARITAVHRGKSGTPGFLKGSADSAACLGQLSKNTPQGVFGKAARGLPGEPLPVALFEEVHLGPAAIRSTVSPEGPREYTAEILKIYPQNREDCRNFLLRITDPNLLRITGGIVQGMSGSPILQDGRIIGAVTHVMVSDPTTGYGIFIGNMLDAAA